jgi:hypothetical protein
MSQYPSAYQPKFVTELLTRLKSRGYEDTAGERLEQPQNIAAEEVENRLLNTRALPEYEMMIGRILDAVTDLNKNFDYADQVKVSSYQNCTSLRFKNRVLVIEFKYVPFNDALIHHSLDLIFQFDGADLGKASRTTLVLGLHGEEFVWHQLQPVVHAPAATSKTLATSLLHWLEDGTDVF